MNAEHLERFTRAQQRRNLAVLTIRRRGNRLRAFAAWLETGLLSASPEAIESWLDSLPIQAPTRNTYLADLAAFYRWATRQGLCPAAPTDWIDRPRLDQLLPRPMPPGDLARAVDLADPRMRCWLLLAALEGLRVAEIAGLRVGDVAPPMLRVTRGKGGRERIVPLHPRVLAALDDYGMPAAGFVFTRRRGAKPLQPSTVSRYVGEFLRGCGSTATAHQGRHLYATMVYAESGEDLLLTQNLLGHRSVASTQIYAQFSQAKASKVVRNLTVGGDGVGPSPE